MKKINADELKLFIKIIDMPKLKAIVSIDFGEFKIKGFRVNLCTNEKTREQYLWITPPSYQDTGKRYHPIFYTEDKNLWEQIKTKILKEYQEKLVEYHKKKFGLDDEDI